MDLKSVQQKLPRAIEKGNWEEVKEMLEEAKSSDTEQEILSEDKLVLMAVFNNAPMDVVTSLISPSNINVQDKDGDTALHKVVRENRWELVPVLLQHGADANALNIWIQTPLHDAVYHDATADIVTRLISPHNINIRDRDGDTALHVAMRKKRWELLPVLLQQGADVNMGNNWNETPLYNAVYHDATAENITQLISSDNINMQGGSCCITALHAALHEERWVLVPILLQHGADVNLCDRKIQTPLHWAILFGAPADIIRQLISPHNINVQNENGDTVLHKAVKKKRWELVPVLLQNGADVNRCNSNQETPFHLAAHLGAPANVTAQLISSQNVNIPDEDGETVLHVAATMERWELVPILLQHSVDVNLENDCSETPLHVAVQHGAQTDIITQLISPLNINMQDSDGDTVLQRVVRAERYDLVPVLLQHGADVNLCNEWNQTALHAAVDQGSPVEIITQVFSPDNINMQDKDGDTALHVSVKKKRWDLVAVLLQHGADPFMHDILPEPPRPLSLLSLCIATIRSHIPVKSDEIFERLRLPQTLLSELKLKPLADEIVAVKQRIDMT